MTKWKVTIAALMLVSVAALLTGGACEDSPLNPDGGICGDCGTVANGDTTITGDARLDGLFKAVGTLGDVSGSIKGSFDADVRGMAEVWGVADADAMGTADLVAAVKAKIEGEITANVSGGLKVKYTEPKCTANVDVAVSAQAKCEAKVDASCSAEVECSGGELSFECEGECSGSCDAECEIPTCKVELTAEAKCEGTCSGGCAVEVDAVCEGKCEGGCSGSCSAYIENTEGEMECSGSCDGTCSGTCEASVEAECTGECRGSCELRGEAAASCEGELGCKGSCGGSCSGSCEGEVSAPKCEGQASCDANVSADCEASASAQASASLECTPPALEIVFELNANLDAKAKAEFIAKLEDFKVRMIGIIQGQAKLEMLINGNAELNIDSPIVTIRSEIEAMIDAGFGGLDISIGLLPCALPALQASVSILGSFATDMAVTLKGQADLFMIIK